MRDRRRSTLAPARDRRFPVPLRGVEVDAETRCVHHDSPRDVIALRCACCEAYAPCHACHEVVTGRPFEPWPAHRRHEPSVYCGACRQTLTAEEYLASPDGCSRCAAAFNPGCREHHDLYFETEEAGQLVA